MRLFLGSGEDPHQRFLVQLLEDRDTGRRPTNSGMSPYLMRSSGCTCSRLAAVRFSLRVRDLGAENQGLLVEAAGDLVFQADEGAAADEEDVGGVDLEELLVRVLAPALGRHVALRALEDLQQRLLDAFAGDVAGDRRIVGLARDLVDLVDVDDAALRLFLVVAGRLVELQDDVLDVLGPRNRPR